MIQKKNGLMTSDEPSVMAHRSNRIIDAQCVYKFFQS